MIFFLSLTNNIQVIHMSPKQPMCPICYNIFVYKNPSYPIFKTIILVLISMLSNQ